MLSFSLIGNTTEASPSADKSPFDLPPSILPLLDRSPVQYLFQQRFRSTKLYHQLGSVCARLY